MRKHATIKFLTVAMSLVATLGGAAAASNSTRGSHTATPVSTLRQLVTDIRVAQSQTTLPSNLIPSLTSALGSSNYSGPCIATQLDPVTVNQNCNVGDLSSTQLIVVYGDSLAGMWVPAMDLLGKADHFKVTVVTRKACPFATLPLTSYVDQYCANWKINAVSYINSIKPQIVVFAEKNVGSRDRYTPTASTSVFAAGVKTAINSVSAPTKIVLQGVPFFNPGNGLGRDPLGCLATILSEAKPLTMCDTPSNQAFAPLRLAADKVAAVSAHAAVVSLTPLFCGKVNCPIVVDDQFTMANEYHIPTWWAAYVANALRDLVGHHRL